jgi:hypothetical protein
VTAAPATWWHAVDLIRTHWLELLATRRFTTDRDIVRAVTFGLDWRGPSSLARPTRGMC